MQEPRGQPVRPLPSSVDRSLVAVRGRERDGGLATRVIPEERHLRRPSGPQCTDNRGIMIAHIAIHTPNPESVDELIASMERFAAAGRSQPGLQEVHTMRDAKSGTLLGLALWETREAFDRGVQAMRAAVDDDRFPEWEDSPPEVYVFEDV
jgi:heme-degrading monooxygenase HmoA